MTMNKGKDIWAPRRHGFDDDGPVLSERRGVFRDRAPHVTMEESFDDGAALATQPSVEATVKWFMDD